jgi:hypothetical protein
MVDSPSTVQGDLAAAAEIVARGNGVSWAYDLLHDVAVRHRFSDAWLVLDPGPGTGPGRQVFGLGGAAVELDTARTLLHRADGIYGAPGGLDPMTNRAIGVLCGAAFRESVAVFGGAVDPASGLSSRRVIAGAIARAAACAARYAWSSTLVVLTTAGAEPPEVRWRALAAALRKALRAGDEAGVTVPGVALAVLGNAGPDAVRPFVARVRAALSAAGWDGIDLHAATSRTPEETVDPAQLERLAAERLADAGVTTPVVADPSPTLELELRLLPGVVYVSMATPVVVVSSAPFDSLYDQVQKAVHACLPHVAVQLHTLSDGHSLPARAERAQEGGPYGREHANGNGNGAAHAEDAGPPRAISATAPGGPAAASLGSGGDARVSLLGAAFDVAQGTSEVSIAIGAARGTGRAAAGPLAGGAQATLNALEALAIDVPFYLVSAERAHGVPGEPVVVVLAPKRTTATTAGGSVERLGVAAGADDVEASSRATLGALNRHLARPGVSA